MIITEKVKLKVVRTSHYKSIGYDVKGGDEIEIPVSDLPEGSHVVVDVHCDVCKKQYKMEYRRYMSYVKKNELCTCVKCKNIKTDETNLKKYGFKNVFQNHEVKEKSKNSIINKYGVDNVSKSEDIKNKKIKTNRDRWGNDWGLSNKLIIEKRKNTNLDKYGVENVFQNKDVKKKIIQTNLKKYGVENYLQNEKLYQKIIKKLKSVYKYKDTELHYQCSYEKDFLDKYFDKVNIINGSSIKYEYNEKIKTYYPDFYLPDFNLIIEIKGSYWYNKYVDINIEKKKKCIEDRYNFIFIIDKNYEEFEKIIKISEDYCKGSTS